MTDKPTCPTCRSTSSNVTFTDDGIAGGTGHGGCPDRWHDKPTGKLTDEARDAATNLDCGPDILTCSTVECCKRHKRVYEAIDRIEAIVREDAEQQGIEGCLVAAKWARKDERERVWREAAKRIQAADFAAGNLAVSEKYEAAMQVLVVIHDEFVAKAGAILREDIEEPRTYKSDYKGDLGD